MTDIVALLREAGRRLKDAGHVVVCDGLFAAADELEASAEWALMKWLVKDERRLSDVWISARGGFVVRLGKGHDPGVMSEPWDTRADAIRAALKAWEER